MDPSGAIIDWNSITDNFLYIVPIGGVEDPYYYDQSTVELTEVAQKLRECAGLYHASLMDTVCAIFCWAMRHNSELQTCQMNGVLYFENVVVLSI